MKEFTPDEWAELMEDPPSGVNHGRRRSFGGWWDLEEDFSRAFQGGLTIEEFDQPKKRSIKPENTIRHGTLSAYQNDRCRCELCRIAQREYMQRWRDRDILPSESPDMLQEDDL